MQVLGGLASAVLAALQLQQRQFVLPASKWLSCISDSLDLMLSCTGLEHDPSDMTAKRVAAADDLASTLARSGILERLPQLVTVVVARIDESVTRTSGREGGSSTRNTIAARSSQPSSDRIGASVNAVLLAQALLRLLCTCCSCCTAGGTAELAVRLAGAAMRHVDVALQQLGPGDHTRKELAYLAFPALLNVSVHWCSCNCAHHTHSGCTVLAAPAADAATASWQ